jgi:hypothetical protein
MSALRNLAKATAARGGVTATLWDVARLVGRRGLVRSIRRMLAERRDYTGNGSRSRTPSIRRCNASGRRIGADDAPPVLTAQSMPSTIA